MEGQNEAGPNANPMSRASNDAAVMPADMQSQAQPAAPQTDTLLIQDMLSLPPQQRVSRLISMRQLELDAFLKSLKPKERCRPHFRPYAATG